MEISYAFEKTDYALAQRLAMKHSSKCARGTSVALVINLVTWIFIGFGFVSALNELRYNPHWYISNMLFVVVSALGGIAFHLGYRAYIHRAFLATQRASLEPFPINQHVTVSDLGMEFKSRLGQTLLPWNCLSSVQMLSQHLAIYLTHGQVVVIPNNAFAHTDDASKFTSYITEHVGT